MSDERIHVLVIDDDQAIVDMIRMGLEADGMKVHGAGDGAEGLGVLGREHIDVVVLDIMMPRVDGWMALMDIRNNPALADIPVIMLTAKTQDLAKTLAFKQGVQQYVTKPFNLLELSARVESLARWSRRHAGTEPSGGGEAEFRKLAVRKGGRTVLLTIDDIVYLSARNKSTYAHTFENQYLVDLTLGDLEARLNRESFTRVHRSFLVNLNRVREILRVDGSYVVVAADRDETHIPVARRQVRTFREAVGI
ncbi:MAG TPA: LytTR family DNA-binding domain-containing protein [Coriobacteriia bacterium]|nr:LytTR family DNA-binding domain-containing protein [Coriobacteriia bacterium]